MLIDQAEIIVAGGHGGAGKASFFRKGRGPDGGNGGKGGDLYFQTTTDLSALNRYSGKKNFQAAAGENGGSNRKSGLDASDLTLLVPVGTDLIDENTGEITNLDNLTTVLVCHGGIGGQGNADRANSRMTTPLKSQPGMPGQTRHLKLVLKLIADYGLIGLPNAGKSSLLNSLTAAKAKVADYPFTTLEPNLGVLPNGKIIADIPGLIEGASQGRGLGDRFLKHIEKVKTLLHCVAADSADPQQDYKIVREELEKYNPTLLEKKEIILRTKSDICLPTKLKGLFVSVLDDKTLESLADILD